MLKLCVLVLIAFCLGGWHWISSAQAHTICFNYGSHVHTAPDPDQKWIFLAQQDKYGNPSAGWFMNGVYTWNAPGQRWQFAYLRYKWCGIPA